MVVFDEEDMAELVLLSKIRRLQTSSKKRSRKRKREAHTDVVEIYSDDEDAIPQSVYIDRDEKRAHCYGLSSVEFRRLVKIGAPVVLFNMLALLVVRNELPLRQNSWVEMFEGCGAVKRGFWEIGESAEGFDLLNDPTAQNILVPEGALNAVRMIMSVRDDGGANFGTLCKSWIWICRKKSRRSLMFPLGREPWPDFVREGNQMVAFVTLLKLLLIVGGGSCFPVNNRSFL